MYFPVGLFLLRITLLRQPHSFVTVTEIRMLCYGMYCIRMAS